MAERRIVALLMTDTSEASKQAKALLEKAGINYRIGVDEVTDLKKPYVIAREGDFFGIDEIARLAHIVKHSARPK